MKNLIIVLIVIITGLNTLTGTASYYSNKFHGRLTASGKKYNRHKLTAASNSFELGDSVKVVNLYNKKEVVVVVNDRMAENNRLIDLSYAAADSLDFIEKGITKVKVSKI